MNRAAIAILSALSWVSVGCASGSNDSAPTPTGAAGASNTTGAAGFNGGVGNPGGGGGGGPPLPPEMELESSYEVPVATGHFIWVANPVSGRVAYVDAASLQVRTVEAGNAPTTLASIPGVDDAVIVLNALSDDATILRVAIKDGTLTRDRIAGVAHGANAVTVAANGRWAIAWTDARRVPGVMPFQGFQDLTVMDLGTPQPAKPKVILSVGFRPAAVTFAADGTRAFAITADGITIIDLAAPGGPVAARHISVVDTGAGDAAADVSITPDGRLAVVRREGRASFGIVDLATGEEQTVPAASPVTDVDLTDDGSQVVAVARDAAEVIVLPLGANPPSLAAAIRLVIRGETIGSVVLAPGGGTALLYSNAVATERLTVLTLGTTPTYRVVRVHAPVLSAFASAGGKSAVVLHAAMPASEGTRYDGGVPDAAVADGGAADAAAGAPAALVAANAFSLVPLDADLPARIAPTDARPQSVAISPGADRVLVTVRDDQTKVYGVYMGLFPTLEVQHFPLASPPLTVGVVAAAETGYVAQKHPEGRITFVTLPTGEARTLTGFELGAGVVDWSVGR
jgi:hypothetical protein